MSDKDFDWNAVFGGDKPSAVPPGASKGADPAETLSRLRRLLTTLECDVGDLLTCHPEKLIRALGDARHVMSIAANAHGLMTEVLVKRFRGLASGGGA